MWLYANLTGASIGARSCFTEGHRIQEFQIEIAHGSTQVALPFANRITRTPSKRIRNRHRDGLLIRDVLWSYERGLLESLKP